MSAKAFDLKQIQLEREKSTTPAGKGLPFLEAGQRQTLVEVLLDSFKENRVLFYQFYDSLYQIAKEYQIEGGEQAPNDLYEIVSTLKSPGSLDKHDPGRDMFYNIQVTNETYRNESNRLSKREDYAKALDEPKEIVDYHPLYTQPLASLEIEQAKKNKQKFKLQFSRVVRCFLSEDVFRDLVFKLVESIVTNLEGKSREQIEQEAHSTKNKSQFMHNAVQQKQPQKIQDPERLQSLLEAFKEKLQTQTISYYNELVHHREMAERKHSGAISNEFRNLFDVRFFDETDRIDPDQMQVMNQRIKQIQNQYTLYAQSMLETQKSLLLKLHLYDTLKKEQYCLVDLSLHEIMEALPELEQNAQTLWDELEHYYSPNFFDDCIYRKYGYLFEENSEEKFKEKLRRLKTKMASKFAVLHEQCSSQIKQWRSDYSAKLYEVFQWKDKYFNVLETAQKDSKKAAEDYFLERERQNYDYWKKEKLSLMEEIKEMEVNNVNIELRIANEKFRHFFFRWKLLNKVLKMKYFDRESKEFIQASLEVQEQVKVDLDARVEIAVRDWKKKYTSVEAKVNSLEYKLLDQNFTLENMKRVLAQKNTIIDDLRIQLELNEFDQRHLKEQFKEQEGDKLIIKQELENSQNQVSALLEKNKLLIDKVNILIEKKAISKIDQKIQYTEADKNNEECSFITEVNDALRYLNSQMNRGDKTEVRTVAMGTEMKNVHREICYKTEFGFGVLVNQGVQVEGKRVRAREVQTNVTQADDPQKEYDEVKVLKQELQELEKEVLKLKKQLLEQQSQSQYHHNLKPSQADRRASKVAPSSIASSRSKHLIPSSHSSKAESGQHLATLNPQQTQNEATIPVLTSHASHDVANLNPIVVKQEKKERPSRGSFYKQDSGRQSTIKPTAQVQPAQAPIVHERSQIVHKISSHASRRHSSFRRDPSEHKEEGGEFAELDEELLGHGEEEDEEGQVYWGERRASEGESLEETDSRLIPMARAASSHHKMNESRNVPMREMKNEESYVEYPSLPDNSIFNRLFTQSQQKEQRLNERRRNVREKEQKNWKIALANKNQLQKKFEGMTVYQDNASGQNYVHLEDLRSRVFQTLNQKQTAQIKNQMEETKETDQNQVTLRPMYEDVGVKQKLLQQEGKFIYLEENDNYRGQEDLPENNIYQDYSASPQERPFIQVCSSVSSRQRLIAAQNSRGVSQQWQTPESNIKSRTSSFDNHRQNKLRTPSQVHRQQKPSIRDYSTSVGNSQAYLYYQGAGMKSGQNIPTVMSKSITSQKRGILFHNMKVKNIGQRNQSHYDALISSSGMMKPDSSMEDSKMKTFTRSNRSSKASHPLHLRQSQDKNENLNL